MNSERRLVKRVRFATFVDIRFYDAEEAILLEEDSSDEDEFFDAVEEFEEDEEDVVVLAPALSASALAASFFAPAPAPSLAPATEDSEGIPARKRPRGADVEEASPEHENKRLKASGSALVAFRHDSPPPPPFEVYRDDSVSSSSSSPSPGPSSPPRPQASIGNDENDVPGLVSTTGVFGPFRRPLGERFH